MENAEDFAKKLGNPEFRCSNGFIESFKSRRGIVYKSICGESAAVNKDAVSDWIVSAYEPKNTDETGLFFKCEPDKSLHLKGVKCHGGKKSKDRVSLLIGSNMDGSEKLKLQGNQKFSCDIHT
ncbi:tigger transposable element-derived protein 4-like [Pecten maximus]|uniref:tigger transposable element-derived protein 4-like n=1 Tax=Pecten maximus TaxID=6579 RepID=UPI001459015A|nr:tigger transposable element-derived protein 4-like [Pecten maximus]